MSHGEDVRSYQDQYRFSQSQLRGVPGSNLPARNDVVFKVGSLQLCPKVCLESIPEWCMLSRSMAVALCKVQSAPRYVDLERAARALGIPFRRGGSRLSKSLLEKTVKLGMKQRTAVKRSWHDLAADVSEAGGQPLCYKRVAGRSVRRRVTVREMEANLSA